MKARTMNGSIPSRRRRRGSPSRRAPSRPFVFLNVAISADGKLAPANRKYRPFGSKRDEALLYELRAQADAILCGARTVEGGKVTLGAGGRRYRQWRLRQGLAEYPLRIVASGSGSVDPHAEIFKHRFSPILLLTTERAAGRRLKRLRRLADEVLLCGRKEIDWVPALARLRKEWGVRRLLCEGGGALNGALFQAGLVDEVYVTVCPMVFGGRAAPTLADGAGTARLAEATRLELKSSRRAGDEIFLCYRRAMDTTS
jgi:riboflavin-specific deaminase-like protein